MVNYPSAIDNFSHRTDLVDLVRAVDINELQDAIEAIETELGTNPKGSYADVKTRLANHKLSEHAAATADVNFAGYKAVALACDSGSTLPSSPTTGQWFLHTPTGRKVLMMYNGSSWTPIISLGSMTLYVDGASGTDSQDKGYGTGANAFKTISYAVSQIPGQYTNTVHVLISAGTYTEDITINGKYPTGYYNITFYGTWSSTDDSGTISSATAGSGSSWATITDTTKSWTTNQWRGYFVDAGGTILPIVSNTSTTLTIAGSYGSAPSGSYTIKHPDTTINGKLEIRSVVNISFQQLDFLGKSGVHTFYVYDYSRVQFTYCKIGCASGLYALYFNMSACWVYQSVIFANSNNGLSIEYGGFANFSRTLIYQSGTTKSGVGIYPAMGANVAMERVHIDNFNYGISADGGRVKCYSNPYNHIENCGTGLYAKWGGGSLYKSYIAYSGNTTNENADATTYGFLA